MFHTWSSSLGHHTIQIHSHIDISVLNILDHQYGKIRKGSRGTRSSRLRISTVRTANWNPFSRSHHYPEIYFSPIDSTIFCIPRRRKLFWCVTPHVHVSTHLIQVTILVFFISHSLNTLPTDHVVSGYHILSHPFRAKTPFSPEWVPSKNWTFILGVTYRVLRKCLIQVKKNWNYTN